ncbi:MAG TPA: shikimate dehydrogenase [Vicinamibacterales bacterium]|nr:shikimate dehydrogenase [Vicinamibacterales bacterium]
MTVTGRTTAELRERRDAVPNADLIELRLDTVADPHVAGALAGRRTPVIVTCRAKWEGGAFDGSEDDRKRILDEALALGAEFVDVEWRAGFRDLIARTGGRRVIVSSHDYRGMPADLAAQVQAMRSTGAGMVKVAVTPTSLADTLQLLDLGARDLVLIGMGDYGFPTRVLASRFRSAWTYAGSIREVGQVDAATLTSQYRFASISDATAVYGVTGGAVGHSASPAMHNAAFQALGIDAVYLPLPAVSADDFVRFGRAIGLKGASVTIPHKVALADRVDELCATARRIGAINTVRVDGTRWIGGNTDAEGFLQPLQSRIRLDGLRAAVLGAGGAARAVAVALASTGTAVTLHARDRAKAAAVAAATAAEVGEWPPTPGSWDLLINTTPVGMHPAADQTPVAKSDLTGRYVYDLVYNPPLTRLLRDAADVGCETFGGLDMLVAQAHEQFQWWTGTRPPAGVMREAALKRLAECA